MGISMLLSRRRIFYISRIIYNIYHIRTKKGKEETCYSQNKLIINKQYQMAIVVSHQYNFVDISLYLNGIKEAELSLGTGLESPHGYFLFGSETSLNCFNGEITKPSLYLKPLNDFQVKETSFRESRTGSIKSLALNQSKTRLKLLLLNESSESLLRSSKLEFILLFV